nr:hypothetical protein [Mesorhizobium waimense]
MSNTASAKATHRPGDGDLDPPCFDEFAVSSHRNLCHEFGRIDADNVPVRGVRGQPARLRP